MEIPGDEVEIDENTAETARLWWHNHRTASMVVIRISLPDDREFIRQNGESEDRANITWSS